jgi:hypothetical protein
MDTVWVRNLFKMRHDDLYNDAINQEDSDSGKRYNGHPYNIAQLHSEFTEIRTSGRD